VAVLRTERFRTAGGITDLAVTAMAVAAMHPIAFAAEGVETEDAVMVLRSLGCDRAQGYLFGRPRTAETVFAPETL